MSSSLYQHPIENLAAYMEELLESAAGNKPLPLFFRADDIGIPSENLTKMIRLFQQYELPLCLAVVPSWLTAKRLQVLHNLLGRNNALFCLHQHGRLHRNFEVQGKKQEFGPAREKKIVKASLAAGKKRLEELLQDEFSPCFTPPWNRCSISALESLNELHFKIVSGSSGTPFPPTPPLQSIPVNIDLHTGKEANQQAALISLQQQFLQAGASGRLGIMLHHQRMNAQAFLFLETLLSRIAQSSRFMPVHFGHMVP